MTVFSGNQSFGTTEAPEFYFLSIPGLQKMFVIDVLGIIICTCTHSVAVFSIKYWVGDKSNEIPISQIKLYVKDIDFYFLVSIKKWSF